MAVTYTDQEIALLVAEPKVLPDDLRTRTRMATKRGHSEGHVEITGEGGGEFRLILRQSAINPLDFSAILAVRVPQSNRVFRLRRYNGKSHQHTNHIEGGSFFDFHIHFATERYQDRGEDEDSYAEPTDRYGTLQDALRCLIADAGFIAPPAPQDALF